MSFHFLKSFVSICFLVIFTTAFTVAAEEGVTSQAATERLMLERRVAEIAREKGELQQVRKAWVQNAIQPYREYLLQQQSLDFAGLSARIEQLEREGEEVAEQLARMEPVKGRQLQSAVGAPSLHLFPTFSGAPPLSFNESSRIDEVLFSRPGWDFFIRVALYALLLAIVIFPLAALVQILRPRRRRLAPVIEISSGKRKGPDQEIPKKKAA